jgi:hypothetical protein
MENFAKIYGIVDSRTGRVMYVGKAMNPKVRMQKHIRESQLGRRKTPLYQWMAKRIAEEKQPSMVILASATSLDWQSLETQMIAQYRAEGSMLNLANGGDQPLPTSEQNQKAAHKLNLLLKEDRVLRRIREIKQQLSQFLKGCAKGNVSLETERRIKEKLRLAGHLSPKIFGEYKTL